MARSCQPPVVIKAILQRLAAFFTSRLAAGSRRTWTHRDERRPAMKLCFEKLEAAWVPWVLIGAYSGRC